MFSVLLEMEYQLKCKFCQPAHWTFIIAICFWEATFGYKSYHLSDCYRLYISCKNNRGKTLNYQTDLSDWYQLYISCKINIEISITLSNWNETIRSINYKTDDSYSCNHAEWEQMQLIFYSQISASSNYAYHHNRQQSNIIVDGKSFLLWYEEVLVFAQLAPCQWGSHPDTHPHILMINYSMIGQWPLPLCKTLTFYTHFPRSSFRTNVSGCVRPSSNYSMMLIYLIRPRGSKGKSQLFELQVMG